MRDSNADAVDKPHVFRLIGRYQYEGDTNYGIFSRLGLAVQIASGLFNISSYPSDMNYEGQLLIFEYELDSTAGAVACYDHNGNPLPLEK